LGDCAERGWGTRTTNPWGSNSSSGRFRWVAIRERVLGYIRGEGNFLREGSERKKGTGLRKILEGRYQKKGQKKGAAILGPVTPADSWNDKMRIDAAHCPCIRGRRKKKKKGGKSTAETA